MAKYMQRFDEPPALTKGSVMPIQGSSIRHMPMLIITCELS